MGAQRGRGAALRAGLFSGQPRADRRAFARGGGPRAGACAGTLALPGKHPEGASRCLRGGTGLFRPTGTVGTAAGRRGGTGGVTAKRLGGEYLQFSGTISLWLSLFNLLPVLPLDGGRILELLAGEKIARAVSLTGAVLFLVDGIVLLALYRVPAPATVGLWLLLCQFRNAKNKIL